MSFWNNPQNNSIKMLLFVLVLVGVGAFVYHTKNSGDTGRVIGTPAAVSAPAGGVARGGCGDQTCSEGQYLCGAPTCACHTVGQDCNTGNPAASGSAAKASSSVKAPR